MSTEGVRGREEGRSWGELLENSEKRAVRLGGRE
jgi:hypothetical protein